MQGEELTDDDLQTIARLGHLMIRRNPEKTISHAVRSIGVATSCAWISTRPPPKHCQECCVLDF